MALNIQIINQSEEICSLLCRFARIEGHMAECTSVLKMPGCGSDAAKQQKISTNRPDVIIIEVTMPESDAIESVKRLHQSSVTKNIPIIVVSDSIELEFEFTHIFDFICKPIDLQRLRDDLRIIANGEKKRDLSVKRQLTADEHLKFHDFLILHCGLHFERRNIKMLERGLASRMSALQLASYSDYYEYLEHNLERRQELQKLLHFLTVGETFFFRYNAHFEAFTQNTLADLMKRPTRSGLRIWSAGCSTGEEPYSIAMAIMEAIPDWKKRDIKIIATDINSTSLKRAKEGVYKAWKIRVTPKNYLEKYFTIIGDSYLVRDEVKSLVDFSYFNLQSSPPLGAEPFDIIFCRNVMIYFTTATTKKVVEMFADSLTTGGYLYLGHSETLMNVSSRFERQLYDGSFYYRKKTAPVLPSFNQAEETIPLSEVNAKTEKPLRTPVEVAPLPVKPAETINPDALLNKGLAFMYQELYQEAAQVFEKILLIKPEHTGAILATAQVHRAQGKSAEALSFCDRALAVNDLLPEGYFLRGLLFEMDDRINDALEEYRKAVLLKMAFVMPHYQLGKLYFRTGDTNAALRELRNCIKLLEKSGREYRIPFSGGLTREVFLAQARDALAAVESSINSQER